MKIDPFKISYPKQRIVEIKEKVEMFPWHEMPKEGGWSFGTNIDYMKNLADYWTKKYDWESQELKLNQQPNYKTKVDDIVGKVDENTAMIKATITDPEKMEKVMSERIPEIAPKLGLEHEMYTLTKMNN